MPVPSLVVDKHGINLSSPRCKQRTKSPCALLPALRFSGTRLPLTRLLEREGIHPQQLSELFRSVRKTLAWSQKLASRRAHQLDACSFENPPPAGKGHKGVLCHGPGACTLPAPWLIRRCPDCL